MKVSVITVLAALLVITGVNSFAAENANIQKKQLKKEVSLKNAQIDFVPAKQGSKITTSQTFGIIDRLLYGRGATWDLWMKLHEACMKSDWLKDPYYFGPSNTLSIGNIVSDNYEPRNGMTTYYFSETELNDLINEGTPTSCIYDQEVKMDFKGLVQASKIDAELSTVIENASSITASIDSWAVNNLLIDRLKGIINNSTNTKILEYKGSLLESGNKILTKAVKVNGFKSTIVLKNDINAQLKSRLESGLTQKLGDTGVEVKFEYVNDRTISMKTTTSFFVFGEYMKAKKVTL